MRKSSRLLACYPFCATMLTSLWHEPLRSRNLDAQWYSFHSLTETWKIFRCDSLDDYWAYIYTFHLLLWVGNILLSCWSWACPSDLLDQGVVSRCDTHTKAWNMLCTEGFLSGACLTVHGNMSRLARWSKEDATHVKQTWTQPVVWQPSEPQPK